MPDISTEISFLANLDLYRSEKPYFIFWGADQKERPLAPSNLKFDVRKNIRIRDIRENRELFSLDKNGFEVVDHISTVALPLEQVEDITRYKSETREMLMERFGAVDVHCFDAKIRENAPPARQLLDLRNPLCVERPARSPHTDATKDSGPAMVENHLTEHMRSLLTPGRRVRIVNTWRSMLSVVDDCPIAFMDYSSAKKHDQVAVDRILPHVVGEIYYSIYNPEQQWYWLDKMTRDEPAIFLTYDSHPAAGAAKYCTHVAVNDPRTTKEAPLRKSVETRSIVITEA